MGRGAGRFDRGRGRGRFSWTREVGDEDLSTNRKATSASDNTERWDEAATGSKRTQSGGFWVERNPNRSGFEATNNYKKKQDPELAMRTNTSNQVPPPHAYDPCLICKSTSHTPAGCPQAFCERCSKMGHLASVCTVFLPWECIAPMCAFQAKGQGFYYIPDSCTAKQLKERDTSVIITMVEGEASTKDLEDAFSDYIGTKWRCTARSIGPDTYVMRFPNQRDVKKACYNDRMTLRSCGVVVKIAPWSANVGVKGVMEMAWVKVANVSLERTNERNLAYVSSLAGVPLEIDMATLHKPEFVWVRLGCRNVDEIPGVAEAVLGTHCFDFFYEIEKVLVRDPEREASASRVEANQKNSMYKKQKLMEEADPRLNDKKEDAGMNIGNNTKQDRPVDKEEEENDESDESEYNTLLIDSIAREARYKENMSDFQTMLVVCDSKHVVNEIQVEELEGKEFTEMQGMDEYMVQYPASSSDDVEEMIPTPPLKSEETLRFSVRNLQNKEDKIQDKAIAVSKKRNLEGLMKPKDADDLRTRTRLLKETASKMMRICVAVQDGGEY